MAAIEERSGRFRIHFRWHGRQEKASRLGKGCRLEEAAQQSSTVLITS